MYYIVYWRLENRLDQRMHTTYGGIDLIIFLSHRYSVLDQELAYDDQTSSWFLPDTYNEATVQLNLPLNGELSTY